MTRILIDATNTASTGYTTGIQRVVRRVAECAQGLQSELGVECVPVFYRYGHFFSVPDIAQPKGWGGRLSTALQSSAGSAWWSFESNVSPAVSSFVQRVGTRCRKTFYPRTLARALAKARVSMRYSEIQLQPDDIILLLDASWSTPPALYESARQRGCFMAQVVYDLIPLTHRQFVPVAFTEQFEAWINAALDQVDCCWAISQTVCDELQEYYQKRLALQHESTIDTSASRLSAEKFRAFRLGADLATDRVQATPRRSIKKLFSGPEPVFFSVGTIEPRKNHKWLLAAFSKYWEQGGQAKLVLAGRRGWHREDICNAIEQHPLYGRNLLWYTNAKDTEVQYMYKHARAFVFASMTEGFGLPIVESLHQGTCVLASDIPIHREVGGDNATYFSLGDHDDLVKKLHCVAGSTKPTGLQDWSLVPTWEVSTRRLLSDVLKMASQRQGHDRQPPARGAVHVEAVAVVA